MAPRGPSSAKNHRRAKTFIPSRRLLIHGSEKPGAIGIVAAQLSCFYPQCIHSFEPSAAGSVTSQS